LVIETSLYYDARSEKHQIMVIFVSTEIYGTLHLKTYPNGIGSKPLENISQNIAKWSCIYIQNNGRHSCMFCVHSCVLYVWIQTKNRVFYFDTTL